MKQKATLSLGGVVLAVLAAIFLPKGKDQPASPATPSTPAASQPAPVTPPSAKVETPAPSQPATAPSKAAPSSPQPTPPAKADPKPMAPPKATPTATNPPKTGPPANADIAKVEPKTGLPLSTSKVGWTSRAGLESHFEKHGAEFGNIAQDDYLAMAKALRDAPLSKEVLEIVRDSDGVISRFHTKSGAFTAFNKDQTIRTLFKPNDGINYFRRQGDR